MKRLMTLSMLMNSTINHITDQEIDAEDTFTIQCTYLDAMEILIDKGNVKEGTRPEETTTEATTAAEDASVEETTEAEETTAE